MIAVDDIWPVLKTVNDPEMPINIVDLGLVNRIAIEPHATVAVDLTPTFVGCPALFMIQQEVTSKLLALAGVERAVVSWVYDPPWTVDRISAAGKRQLEEVGISVPHGNAREEFAAASVVQLGLPGRAESVACPLCGSSRTTLESAFGPTRCKMIYYCNACRNQFENMKRI